MFGTASNSEPYLSLLTKFGAYYNAMGENTKALDYYKKGMAATRGAANQTSHVEFLRLAGQTLDSLGERRQAVEYHQKGLEILRSTKAASEQEAQLLISMAKILKDQDADLGITHLRNALRIAQLIGNRKLTAEIYHSLQVLYRQQAKYEQAIWALDAFYMLNDSLVNSNKGHQITVLQNSYELLETKTHVHELQLENQKRPCSGICI